MEFAYPTMCADGSRNGVGIAVKKHGKPCRNDRGDYSRAKLTGNQLGISRFSLRKKTKPQSGKTLPREIYLRWGIYVFLKSVKFGGFFGRSFFGFFPKNDFFFDPKK
jgi:hypothetical protein